VPRLADTHPECRQSFGFTLVELLIGVAVLAVLMAIAVPSFSASRLNGQLRSAANGLVASANLARSEAIKRGSIVRMCVSSNGTACGTGNWRQGWIILSGTEVLHRQAAIPAEFRVTAAGGATTFDFFPTGFDATPGTLVVCRATPLGSQERVISIDAAGRAWVIRSTTGVCS
jgi:type IV fimbrial biogenesis protein FimT